MILLVIPLEEWHTYSSSTDTMNKVVVSMGYLCAGPLVTFDY